MSSVKKSEFITSKVINRPIHIIHSPYKTGTTSVGHALEALGIGTNDMKYRGQLLRDYRSEIRKVNSFANREPDFRTFRKEYSKKIRNTLSDFLHEVADYDIFSDAPFGHIAIHPYVKKIVAPKAKFIWVHRETDSWLDSIERWEISHPETYPKEHKRWKNDRQNKIDELIDKRKVEYRKFFRLLNNFPKDCCELQLETLNTFEPLCEFYNLPVPSTPFPIKNVGKKGHASV